MPELTQPPPVVALGDSSHVDGVRKESVTPPIASRSRNDLFSFDWSPQTPNIRSTPPPARPAQPAVPVTIPVPVSSMVGKDASPPTLHLNLPMTPPLDETVWQGFNEYTTSPSATSLHRPSSYMSASGSSTTPGTSPSISSPSTHPPAKRVAPGPGAGHSSNPVLDSRVKHSLRLSPTRDFLLGEGRHASVYLASWIPANDRLKRARQDWALCAAKRILPDPESQIAGLGEAFILAKLATPLPSTSSYTADAAAVRSIEQGAQHVMTLYGVKDERDGIERPGDMERAPSLRSSPSSQAKLGIGSTPTSKARRAASERQPYRKLFGQGKMLSPLPPSPQDEEKGKTFGFFDAMSRKKAPRHSSPAPAPNSLSGPARLDDEEEEILAEKTSAVTVNVRRGSSVRERPTAPGLAPSITLDEARDDETPIATPRIILLLDFCPFGHLLSFLRANPDSIGKQQWFEWAKQLALAVAWCHHRGVLHADIKPQNVLIAKDRSLKLSDFGMSMFIPSASSGSPLPVDPHGLGTPPYSPPEFVRPLPSPFSFPSDVFSLGVTLSVMLTGREPYEGLRTVERMLYVSRGAFYEYEERRRLAQIGRSANTDGGSGSNSRPASMKSGLSHRSSLSHLNGNGNANSQIGTMRHRSESVESNLSAVSDLYRPSWHVSALASRLLVRSDGSVADAEPNEASTPTTQLAMNVLQASSTTTDEEHVSPSAIETYQDGTPAQYFLDGADVVPVEVRELIRAMTDPRAEARPTAKQVFRRLERLSSPI